MRTPEILITGSNGQVGHELRRALAPIGRLHLTDRSTCDLADPDSIRAAVRGLKPTIIVNAGAYTNVDKAETEREFAESVNARAPGILGEEARRLGATIVHYSTDYVFDGQGATPWREPDPIRPLNYYGFTKAEGEKALRDACDSHLILRTSWVYGVIGKNFPRTILRLARTHETISVVADQWGSPTAAHTIADITALVLASAVKSDGHPQSPGTYHLAASGYATWHEIAKHVVRRVREAALPLKLAGEHILPIQTEDYPTPARRPRNSRLDTSLLTRTFGVLCPAWQDDLDYVMDHWLETI